MNIAELIRKLQAFDGELDVAITNPATGEHFALTGVWLSEGSPDDDEPVAVELTFEP